MRTAITVVFAIAALAACKNDDRSMQPLPIDPNIPEVDVSTFERRCERRLGNRDEPAFSECVVALSETGMTRAPK